MISFNEDRCQGCGLCVEVCPRKLLIIDKSRINKRGHTPVIIIDESKCIGCALCAVMCPDVVIEVKRAI